MASDNFVSGDDISYSGTRVSTGSYTITTFPVHFILWYNILLYKVVSTFGIQRTWTGIPQLCDVCVSSFFFMAHITNCHEVVLLFKVVSCLQLYIDKYKNAKKLSCRLAAEGAVML